MDDPREQRYPVSPDDAPDTGTPSIPPRSARSSVRAGRPQDLEWRPEPGPGFLIGGVILAGTLLMFLLALTQVTGNAGGGRLFWGLILVIAGFIIAAVVYLLVGLRRLVYIFSSDQLIIVTPRWRVAIPYTDVVDIVYRPNDEITLSGREWFWPGYRVAEVETSDGIWHSAATVAPNRRIRIRTRTGAVYAISPWRPVRFVEEFTVRIGSIRRTSAPGTPHQVEPLAGLPVAPVTRPASARRRRPLVIVSEQLASRFQAYRLFRDVLLRDRLMSEAVALSLIIIASMAIYTVYRGDGVNLPLPARWNADGEAVYWLRPDGFWVFEGIWLYVALGSAIFVTNVAIGTFLLIVDQFLARFIVLATPVLLIVVLLALLRVTM